MKARPRPGGPSLAPGRIVQSPIWFFVLQYFDFTQGRKDFKAIFFKPRNTQNTRNKNAFFHFRVFRVFRG